MTVRQEVKERRREIVRASGRGTYEEWKESVSKMAPIHMKIERRAEEERSRRWHEKFWRGRSA